MLLQGPKSRPLLVTTHYGLGKTVAFLSDVKNRWSADWLGWAGYGRFWAQVVRDTIPRHTDGDLTLRVARVGPEASVELRALGPSHGYRSGLVPTVRVTDPEGGESTLRLHPVAPGHYAGRHALASGRPDPYRFQLQEGGGLQRDEVLAVGIRSLTFAWSDEDRALPPDTATLKALSEQTGGVFEPKAADIVADRGDGHWAWVPLWPYLVAAALLVFLLDILWRRAPWLR